MLSMLLLYFLDIHPIKPITAIMMYKLKNRDIIHMDPLTMFGKTLSTKTPGNVRL